MTYAKLDGSAVTGSISAGYFSLRLGQRQASDTTRDQTSYKPVDPETPNYDREAGSCKINITFFFNISRDLASRATMDVCLQSYGI